MKGEDIEDICELSPLQQGMLFESLYAPESGIYIEQISFMVRGAISLPKLERAWQAVVDRHPALRTAFYWEDLEKPLQVIYRHAKLSVERLDWCHIAADQREALLEAYRRAEWKKGLDLAHAPVMRLALVQLEKQLQTLVWTFHHALLDGWSVQLVLREVTTCYEAFARGLAPELGPTRSYAEYIAWLQQQDIRETERYWRRTFVGFQGSVPISRAHLQIDVDDSDLYAEHETWVNATELATLQEFARRHHLTLNSLLQGAWAVLLARYGGSNDVLFGAVVSGRPSSMQDIEHMVGLFINTLPVRVVIDPNAPPTRWLQELQAQQFEARNHEFSSLMDVRRWIGVPGGTPLFDSVLVFENYPIAASSAGDAADAGVRHIERTNVPLTLLIVPRDQLQVKVLYDRRCFDVAAVERLGTHFKTLVASFATASASRLADLQMLSAAEHHGLISAANGSGDPLPLPAEGIVSLFEAQAARTPQVPAFIHGAEHMSYSQLRQRADDIAQRLDRLGLKAGDVVGVCLHRSFDAAAALLAVLKVGALYLPLDPDYPRERLQYMLNNSSAAVLVATRRHAEPLQLAGIAQVLLDAQDRPVARGAAKMPVDHGEDAAYLIYTSGSTGKPKGIVATHAQILNRLAWMWRDYPFAKDEVGCQRTPLSFVDSLWELLGPLLQGIPTAIMSADAVRDPLRLVEELAHHGVTRLWLVPALLSSMLDGLPDLAVRLPRLRFWVTSGEALPADLEQRFRRTMPHATLYNLYGTSETWDATWHDPQRDGAYGSPTSIGRPIPNTTAHVLDFQGRPAPIGVAGELCIGGIALASGYLNAPELTAKKFVTMELMPGVVERVYCTGDLVRRRTDGIIEYVGRSDHQLKLRGHLIDPGEIETLLRSHPSIDASVVTMRHDPNGECRLVAYCTGSAARRPSLAELRAYLREYLPEALLPSAHVFLDAMPLTPSGKIDRRSLPEPESADATSIKQSPMANPIEQKLLPLWQELLGLKEIGLHSHFFTDLGGHSLLAIRMVSRLRETLQIELPVRSLFEAPTIAALADLIGSVGTTTAPSGPELRALPREEFRV